MITVIDDCTRVGAYCIEFKLQYLAGKCRKVFTFKHGTYTTTGIWYNIQYYHRIWKQAEHSHMMPSKIKSFYFL